VSAGLKLETEKELSLLYQGVKIDCAYRADLVVNETVIVEVKAIDFTRTHPQPPAAHIPAHCALPSGPTLELRRTDHEGRDQARGERFRGVTPEFNRRPAKQAAATGSAPRMSR